MRELFLEQLSLRYGAEKMLVAALPNLAERSSCNKLRTLIYYSFKEAEKNILKLDRVFQEFGQQPLVGNVHGIREILVDGESLLNGFSGAAALNAALISVAQKFCHHGIAAYGCLHEWAELLGLKESAGLLLAILDEQHIQDLSLTDLARLEANSEALNGYRPVPPGRYIPTPSSTGLWEGL